MEAASGEPCWPNGPPDQTSPIVTAHDFSKNGLELLKINGLGQVMVETRLDTAPHILVHSESGKRDSFQRPLSLRLSNQFVAAGVGQTNVANQNVELSLIQNLQCLLRGISSHYVMSVFDQQTR